ncbi:N-acetylmuramoyl-L-alanine amidase [Acidobacteria bacterium AH-259-O06]|nr:N-acetylmuramoyl-L-alanine amidase [Acidobacteria bacterium AH-259-O06]
MLHAAPVSQQLEVWVGQRRYEIDSHQRENHTYYRLKEIAAIVGLKLHERGGLLTVQGPRGRFQLVDGRPLVRFESEYILLWAPVWRRKQNDWCVTEDFLTKALPLVVNRKLERLSGRHYRLEALHKNHVQVRVANYSDHVRVVFQSSQKAPIRVKEFDKYIEVEFEEYLVQPEFPSELPDRRFVSSVEFNSSDVYGTFRIHKGNLYYNFRQFTLSDPERNIVDVYGPPRAGSEPASTEPRTGMTFPSLQPDSLQGTLRPSKQAFQNVVTIDPGHGGEDYGVISAQGELEKNLTLGIANQIRARIAANGYRGMLTRTRDVELAIEQRSSVGNYYRSKTYLSIHVGGSWSPKASGPIVYVHKYVQLADTLETETGVDAGSSGRLEARRGLFANDEQKLVPWEEGQRKYLALSRELAEKLQNELNLLWSVDNQVVEVPLAVLAPITAPAVLIEAGFLTNPEDQERLGLSEFQERLAGTIASAVLAFLQTTGETNGDFGLDQR